MITSRTVVRARDIDQTWLGIPSVEVSTRGKIFVAWYSGGEREPAVENSIYVTMSDDQGVTFSEPQILAGPEGPFRAYDPCLWRDPTGALWLIYNRSSEETGEGSVFVRQCDDPDAAEPHWTPSRRINLGVPFAFRLNKPVVLSSGEWVMPITWSNKAGNGWFPSGHEVQGVAISEDDGITWTLYGSVVAPRWALENMVFERKDGSLCMYIRTGSDVIWQSTSVDAGRTWSKGEPTNIRHPRSRFYVGALASGRLLFLNNAHPEQRTGIHACLSNDDGNSFGPPTLLEKRDKVSYPDATQDREGRIYTVHDHDRYGAAEIVLTTFGEEDLEFGDDTI